MDGSPHSRSNLSDVIYEGPSHLCNIHFSMVHEIEDGGKLGSIDTLQVQKWILIQLVVSQDSPEQW